MLCCTYKIFESILRVKTVRLDYTKYKKVRLWSIWTCYPIRRRGQGNTEARNVSYQRFILISFASSCK